MFVVVQSLSCVQLSATRWTAARQVSHLPEFAQAHVHRVGDAIQASHPLLLPPPLALNLSYRQGLFGLNSLHRSDCSLASISIP